ncbi:ABC transporter permease [Nitrogeniibacter mangrovi]|uniref:ABC transporter permease n=1 Tax=Nitrogeniibacter mangrovi TaxID=2016596 RepID=A0A6C1B1R5_9RHOO|nr:ABC transporter permease [Nitrogeniibacter mangrovi]QID17507.1 ABC transporter permease [Nitrogeniibacter mangrovi]
MECPQLRRIDGRLHPQGDWTLAALGADVARLRRALVHADGASWDLAGVTRLDSFGAMLLWRAWGHRLPEGLAVPAAFENHFARLAQIDRVPSGKRPRFGPVDALASLGHLYLGFVGHVADFLALIGRLLIDVFYLLGRPRDWPLKEFSANLHKTGVRAMPVSALVGFLIGVVLSYLSALQLKAFGADIYIVNILGMGIIRELGPVLVSVLVAGRSGSAMTAQLGVMRVTEEVDALTVMGISRYVRLVLPKVMALSVAMPLLVLWTSAIALIGGMVSAELQLGLNYGFFIEALPKAVPAANLVIALSKGVVFGILIALVACHFGLRVKPNTESLSANTTASVVTSITTVILVDAVFAIATKSIGVPI